MPTTDINIPKTIKRVTLAERLNVTPLANGLIVYQTDNKKGFYYWENGKWFVIVAVEKEAGSVRPLTPYIGQTFFDTILGKRIDWDGVQWVNSSGTNADNGLIETNITYVNSNYNALLTNYILVATANCIITLPQILTNIGIVFRIFANGFNVTVNSFTGDFINNATTIKLKNFDMATFRALLNNKYLTGD